MDLNKLTPAPWEVNRPDSTQPGLVNGDRCVLYAPFILDGADAQAKSDLAFAALARNAFDVMMRRKWWAEWDAEIGWVACNKRGWMRRDSYGSWFVARDPFTPLLEADKWMKEQEDASRHH